MNIGIYLVIAHESVETWRTLGMQDFDDLGTIVCVHGREKATWLNAILNYRSHKNRGCTLC